MKMFKISATLIAFFALASCGQNNGTVTGSEAGLTGAAALNSITRFSLDRRTSTLEWDENSLEDLDFVIARCDDHRCAVLYNVSCSYGDCKVREEARGASFDHRWVATSLGNGEKTFRLEICEGIPMDRDDVLQIQASSPDGSGDWVVAQPTGLRVDPYCSPRRQH